MYFEDGRGFAALDLLSIMFQVISQAIIVTLLLLIAGGWTITYTSLPDQGIYVPLGSLVFLLQVVVAGLTYVDYEAIDKFHDFSGLQGASLVVIRVGMWTLFLKWIREAALKARTKILDFVKTLALAGSVYMLAFPVLWVLSYFIASYVRHRVIVIGHLVLQTLSVGVILRQLKNKHSKYFQASTQSKGILPTTKSD